MRLRVLIVRTFPDVLNLNSYNVQEIGLAKALTCKGCECGVVLYNGRKREREENYVFSRNGQEYSFRVYWLTGIGIFKNGFMPSVYRIMKEYDIIQVHEYDQIFSWMLYKRMKKPTVIYHGPYYHEYAKGYNLKCAVFDKLFLGHRDYSDVIALAKSELAADFLRKKGFANARTVGVGIDADNFSRKVGDDLPCLLNIDEGKFRLLYVGKIEERRNVFFLAEVFESILQRDADMQLVIVGDGEQSYRDAFLDRIQRHLDSGNILYYQKATQKELAGIYENIDLLVFPSNYEIFGMVLLEAMYFGKPVISSMNGGASVLIDNCVNGFIVHNFDPREWKEKILALKENAGLYAKMSESAKKQIREHFTWDKLADRFLEAYQEAINMYNGK